MKILVVEDEKDMNHIICKGLKNAGFSVDSCLDGKSGMEYLMLGEYDGAILDVMLPNMDGFEILKNAREEGNTTPILFLTAKNAISDVVKGLNLGADEYMSKPFSFEELIARIHVMTRRTRNVRENVYRCGELIVDCTTNQVEREGHQVELSPREFAILLYMMRNQNQVLTREQIQNNIWDLEYDGSSNIVDVYIRYLRKKIDAPFEKKMIHTIRGVGYLLKSE